MNRHTDEPGAFGMCNRVLSTLLIGISLGLSPLYGGVIVGAPGDSGVGDCVPFGCSDAGIYQQIFDSSLFPSPITIAGLTFFLRNFDNTDPITHGPILPDEIYPANYTIVFSIVSTPVNGLDPIVENNIEPSTARTFFIGGLSGAVSDSFTIQTSPANYFVYDPSLGNLLMDIRNDGTDLTLTVYLDINTAAGGLFSSAFDSDPHPSGCPDGSAGRSTGCTDADRGLVVGFNEPSDFATAAPEPAAGWMALSGVLLIGFGLARRGRRRPARGARTAAFPVTG